MAHTPSPLIRRDVLKQLTPLVAAAVFGSSTAKAQDAVRPPTSDDTIGSVWWVEIVSSPEEGNFELYKSTLGWTSRPAVQSDDPPRTGEDPPYTLFEVGGTEVAGGAVANKADAAKNRPMWIVYFRVDNVERSIARALAAGARLLSAPYDVPGAARMAVLADLNDVVFGVAAPLAG